MRDAIAKKFGSDGPLYTTAFGVDFDFNTTARRVFDFSSSDHLRLSRTLQRDSGAVRKLFLGDVSVKSDGLAERFLSVLKAARGEVNASLGSSGVLFNAFA